jgi:hypothetical protein
MPEGGQEVDEDILQILRRLAYLEERALLHNRVPLSTAARASFEGLRKTVYDGAEVLDGRARDWWSKVPAHALRLAGTLAYLHFGLHHTAEPQEISDECMQAASAIVLDYFWPHAQACLRQIGLTQRHADARRVLRWIKAKDLDVVTREEIRQNALGKTRDADETEEILNFLSRAGWLRKGQHETGGRPAVRWSVNPRLREVV